MHYLFCILFELGSVIEILPFNVWPYALKTHMMDQPSSSRSVK